MTFVIAKDPTKRAAKQNNITTTTTTTTNTNSTTTVTPIDTKFDHSPEENKSNHNNQCPKQ